MKKIIPLIVLFCSTFAHAQIPLLSTLRGVNIGSKELRPEAIAHIADWKANVIRVNFGRDTEPKKGNLAKLAQEDPLALYSNELANFDKVLDECDKHRISVILSAARIWNWQNRDFWDLKKGKEYREHFLNLWTALAEKYKGRSTIIAYEVLNEPNYRTGEGSVWMDTLLPQAIAAIRKVNPGVTLIVESGPWGMPKGFETMRKIDDPNIIYSFHMYAPQGFTHQGIKGRPKGSKYPGIAKNFPTSADKMWDKAALKEYMKPAIEFQQKNNVRMYVGEFSAVRWAPGAAQYLKDCIDLFEELGFDWTYHSYAGWNGWNPTFSPRDLESDNMDGGKKTDRLDVLLESFQKNK